MTESCASGKQILFVDTFCGFGHRAMTRVMIGALVARGYAVTVVGRQGYFEALGLPKRSVTYRPIPSVFFEGSRNAFQERFRQLRLLRMIYHRDIRRGVWDHVILSYFDEIALWASRIPGPIVLVNHSNVAGLASAIKRWCFLHVCRDAPLVVFDELTRQRALDLGAPSVFYEPLGLDAPFESVPSRLLGQIDARLVASRIDNLVFAPAGAKLGDHTLTDALRDSNFRRFLEQRGILFVVRGGDPGEAHPNIVTISRTLLDKEYVALLLASRCVVLSYPWSFEYRTSALLMECFANAKPCVVSDIPGFRAFAPHFAYDPFFANSSGLQVAIARVFDLAGSPAYRDLSALEPRYDFLAEVGSRV